METHSLSVPTGDRFACVDLTPDVADWLSGHGDGMLTVFVPHATAGIALLETGAGTETDLNTAITELLPREDDRWRHRHGSPGHGADHVLPAFVAPSITVPVTGGRMMLGTWQSVVLVDPNVDNPVRTVILAFLSG